MLRDGPRLKNEVTAPITFITTRYTGSQPARNTPTETKRMMSGVKKMKLGSYNMLFALVAEDRIDDETGEHEREESDNDT